MTVFLVCNLSLRPGRAADWKVVLVVFTAVLSSFTLKNGRAVRSSGFVFNKGFLSVKIVFLQEEPDLGSGCLVPAFLEPEEATWVA